jgi:hypothetical protein
MEIKFVKSDRMDLVGGAGLSLIGQLLSRYTTLGKDLTRQFPKRTGAISTGDVAVAYVATLCTGKSDFEAVSTLKDKVMMPESLGIETFPSPVTVRQRLDEGADLYMHYVQRATGDLLRKSKAPITALSTGHVALDVDVTPLDNSNTKKEGIGWTYKQFNGYAPIAAYLGEEGWALGFELREGTQHCQKETPAFLARVIPLAQRLAGRPVLLRLDSGNDALENYALAQGLGVDFLAKHNWRTENLDVWADKAYAKPESAWSHPRDGKRVVRLSEWQERTAKVDGQNVTVRLRMVVEVSERTTDPQGNQLLLPLVGVDAWMTSLDLVEEKVIALYRDHGTSEQFHSEMKSELDLERLPSGKFVTNALILEMGVLAYNLLRLMGQVGLQGYKQRHESKRRRLRTVIQELLCVAARVVHHAGQVAYAFGRNCLAFDRLVMLRARFSGG